MDATSNILAIIGPCVEAMGYEVVRVQLSGTQRRVLQVMAERSDRNAMTVDDCAELSRAISAVLDVEDPIPGEYVLEVSSPGIDRPLTRLADFERFRGFEARVELHDPIDGRRRFKGRLRGVDGDLVGVDLADGSQVALPFADIQKAKLVLTDELIEAVGGVG